MPNFDWKCSGCGIKFEKITSSQLQTTHCPWCAAQAVRLPAAPAFKVKGYRADTGYTTKD
jgi:putative FmdB family regulatory protein